MLNVLINKISTAKEDRERIILSNIRFELEKSSIYTIIGKNGSGKSTLLKSLTKLLDERFYSVDGNVLFNNEDIFRINETELQKIRKNEIKYVFQDSINSFDHLKTFGYYFRTFLSLTKEAADEVDELLEFFLLPYSKIIFNMYPYEVSGGMAQRISFILALLVKPRLIFLDEPTSSIDAPIINLLLIKLKEFIEKGNSALIVTQDIELAKSISNKIAIISDRTISKFTSPEEFFRFNLLGIEI